MSWKGSERLTTGVPQGSEPPFSFPYTLFFLAILNLLMGSASTAMLTTCNSSFLPSDSQFSACISAWHFLHNDTASPEVKSQESGAPVHQGHDLTITLGNTVITPISKAQNLGVIFDEELNFHLSWTCRYLLSNIRIFIHSSQLIPFRDSYSHSSSQD